MREDQLRALTKIAEARELADLARLEALMAEQRRIEAEIAELARTGIRDLGTEVVPMAQIGLRAIWAEQRIGVARDNLAALAPKLAAARAAAVASLGKHQALEDLAAKAARRAKAAREARQEREAPPAE